MKITHCILKYGELTGSELYVYELAREQSKKHEVTIQSNIADGLLLPKTRELGIKVISFRDESNPDIVHSHQKYPTLYAREKYSVPIVQTIHSEIMPKYEYPIGRVHHISIRPSVAQFVKDCGFESDLIFNPIDFSRFNHKPLPKNKKPKVLFIGSNDILRRRTIEDLMKYPDLELIGVGNDWDFPGITSFKPTFDVENLIEECDYTAGIKIGRSTIEGWLCNRPGIVYDVDKNGEILNRKILEVPKNLKMFDSKLVAKQIENIYEMYCNHNN